MAPLSVAVLLFDGFETLDVFGPVEVFGSSEHFKVFTVAAKAGPVQSGQGIESVAKYGYDEGSPAFDILLVPGAKLRLCGRVLCRTPWLYHSMSCSQSLWWPHPALKT